jgi:CBS domain-containing protein
MSLESREEITMIEGLRTEADERSAGALCAEIRRRAPFDRMREEHVQWLARRMQRVVFPPESVILTPANSGDAFYFIHQGEVLMEAMGHADEAEKILAELVAGECFPLEALQDRRPVFSTFRAKMQTVCFRASLDDFDELERQSAVFAEFCRYRAAGFLEQSRRVYRLHFSHQSEEQQRLALPLSLLMRPDPLTVGAEEPLRAVVAAMDARDLDVAVIVDDDRHPLGTFAPRDLLRAVAGPENGLDAPVDGVMTGAPRVLPTTALGFEAALALAERGSHHVLVVEEGRLVGTVAEHELFNLQRASLSQIHAEIRRAEDLGQLKRCRREIQLVAENMLLQGVAAEQITQIISSLNDQVTRRVLALEFADADLQGVRFSWVAFGSEGRFEQTFATDQDNGIVFEQPPGMSDNQARALLLPRAQRVTKALDLLGFPLCAGNIMAGNEECCLSGEEWRGNFRRWIGTPDPEALLKATIFFDFRHLSGDAGPAERLLSWLPSAARGQERFLHLLAEAALQRTPPLGFFRDFIVDNDREHPGTFDIKLNGVSLFVDAARVAALAAGVSRSNTKARLTQAGDVLGWPQSEVGAWAEAFSFLQALRIRNQFTLRRNGCAAHNRIRPDALNDLDRRFLLEALRQAKRMQNRLGGAFLKPGGSVL